MTEKIGSKLPQFPEPFWRDFVALPAYEKLANDIETDVAIVGGGITGITAAYLLAKAGVNVVLIEAGDLLNGTTGHTTAKVTAQHGLIYDQLIKDIGEEAAKLYYEANNEALKFIKDIISELGIDCELTTEDAYVFAMTDEYVTKIQDELKAYKLLGIPGAYAESIPFSISCKAAVIMKDQAQFHPVKYLSGLLQEITEMGGKIFEQTTAATLDDEAGVPIITTRDGHKIKCNYSISASHFPFNDAMGFYFARMHAERSYVIAIKSNQQYPGGMYINAETPTRSLRYTKLDGEDLILVSGDHHKTGQDVSTHKHYEALVEFSEKYLGVSEIPYRWSAQDMVPIDKIPFIGQATEKHPNVLVATGYKKWGMTSGTAAALLLSDLILKKENRFAELFSPSRFHAKPGLKNIIRDNADVVKHFVEGKFAMVDKHPDELGPDQAALVKINGNKAGCYRDLDGQIHLVDSTCTHMGCEVQWNDGERTWDCPCHGSRFSIDGEVVEGPAVEPLKKIKID
ncbi:FAD-dependent oxidoreductase [Peribacillus sp. SCS-155]|uniref:FAD-dependent oxidoreductase n=1 Tax=Peribacillus sedimenti TaxID=3115297 RepID=UPI0039058FB3